MEMLQALPMAFWKTTVAMAPWLLVGFLAAGLLSLFFTADFIQRHLGHQKGWRGIVLSVLLGVPLPLCSCGVLPVAVGLRKGGASKGATAAFLISTPQTGVDSFFATYSLLGWAFALMRPIVALFSGLLGGWWVNAVDRERAQEEPSQPVAEKTQRLSWKRLITALEYGYGELLGNVSGALLIGLLISTLIAVFVPENFFDVHGLGSDWVAFPVMLLIGMPMYVCSTASIPVAMALIAKGISPGAALVFLIVGPALNGASLTTLFKLLGKRCTFIHLLMIAGTSVCAGLLLNGMDARWNLVPDFAQTTACCAEPSTVALWQVGCSILLWTLLFYHLVISRLLKMRTKGEMTMGGTRIVVKGMMCDHCRGTVLKLLKGYSTLTAVQQVAPDAFEVEGTLPETLEKDIADLGFEWVK